MNSVKIKKSNSLSYLYASSRVEVDIPTQRKENLLGTKECSAYQRRDCGTDGTDSMSPSSVGHTHTRYVPKVMSTFILK